MNSTRPISDVQDCLLEEIEDEIFAKLHEAEEQAKRSSKRFSSSEVLSELEKITNV